MQLKPIVFATCLSLAYAGSQESTAPVDFGDQIGEYVHDVMEARNGDLWFGTFASGAACFDGETLTYFTETDGLTGGPVTSIAEDKKGRLWFGTHRGISRYDGTTFRVIETNNGGFEDRSSVRADRKGNIWVTHNGSVLRSEGDTLIEFELPIPKDEITTYAITPGRASFVCDDSAGNLWFRTDGYGALKYDGETFTRLTKEDGLPSNSVNGIAEGLDGRIWFICMQAYQPHMTGDGGLCVWDGETFKAFPDLRGLSGGDLYSLYVEPTGEVWVGASGVGAYRFDKTGPKLFEDIERREDLTRHVGITAILRDSRGELWFGMSGGLFRMKDDKLINVTKSGPWPSY